MYSRVCIISSISKRFSNFNFNFIPKSYFPYTNLIFSIYIFPITLYITPEKKMPQEANIEKKTPKAGMK